MGPFPPPKKGPFPLSPFLMKKIWAPKKKKKATKPKKPHKKKNIPIKTKQPKKSHIKKSAQNPEKTLLTLGKKKKKK